MESQTLSMRFTIRYYWKNVSVCDFSQIHFESFLLD